MTHIHDALQARRQERAYIMTTNKRAERLERALRLVDARLDLLLHAGDIQAAINTIRNTIIKPVLEEHE